MVPSGNSVGRVRQCLQLADLTANEAERHSAGSQRGPEHPVFL